MRRLIVYGYRLIKRRKRVKFDRAVELLERCSDRREGYCSACKEERECLKYFDKHLADRKVRE